MKGSGHSSPYLCRAGRRLAHDEAAQRPHFLVDEADGVVVGIVAAETVRADQLGQPVGLVRLGHVEAAHLVQDDGHAGLGQLPGGLRAGKAAADDMDGFRDGFGNWGRCHGSRLAPRPGRGKRAVAPALRKDV